VDGAGPLDLERAGWSALARGGPAAAAFYEEVLAAEVLMILPGDLVIDDRRRAVTSMAGPGWDSYAMTDERVVVLDERCAAVSYRATASRSGDDYDARFTSTYVRDGDAWRLRLHQQTPV
jgi:hypothetical protein